jgi:hypothetical protein
MDTKMPIPKAFHVSLGSGVLSYPACSPIHRELYSTEFLRRHSFMGLTTMMLILF